MITPAAARKWTRGLLAAIGAAALLAAGARRAGADDEPVDTKALNERCANRLAIAFLGRTASPDQFTAADPKKAVAGYLKGEEFRERFARFINSEFNDAPAGAPIGDAPYWLAKKVLEKGTPWSDMFLGKYDIVNYASNPAVVDDSGGLGYFRNPEWFERYQGNEPNGVKIATAYRIMNNVVGLHLSASTGQPNTDQTATGRKAQGCAQCHYDDWYALDKVASILPARGQDANAYKGGPKEVLGGKQVSNDRELVAALVESENFSVNACRLAFKYLYGREDNKCEGPLLDKCVDTFKAEKTMQSALALIADDATFCE